MSEKSNTTSGGIGVVAAVGEGREISPSVAREAQQGKSRPNSLMRECFRDAGDCPVRSVEIQKLGDGPTFDKHVGELWLGAEWITVKEARELRDWLNEVIP